MKTSEYPKNKSNKSTYGYGDITGAVRWRAVSGLRLGLRA
jgi:hypothetical protein